MLRTLKQLKNIKGKRAVLRVDFNVPIDRRGVTDDTRIRETLPTIKFLVKKGAAVVIITHLGRPEGKTVDGLKLDAVAKQLSKLLHKPCKKIGSATDKTTAKRIKELKPGNVVLLENIRFHPQEETCEPAFVKKLASLGDIFVNDAFAACHRKHASTAGIAKLLPSYAGFLVEREIKNLTPLLKKPARPIVVIVGGAKIDTKIGLIKSFFGKADAILIGGALANTFLAAEGFDIGRSLYEKNKIETAREILMLAEKRGQTLLIPEDAVVADSATNYAKTLDLPLEDIEGDMKILDIGGRTRHRYVTEIRSAKTVIWNGPMGLYEFTPFSGGTLAIARQLARQKGKTKTFAGGGDTLDALARFKIPSSKFTFVSTGGGAMLEFLEGRALPGIKALMD